MKLIKRTLHTLTLLALNVHGFVAPSTTEMIASSAQSSALDADDEGTCGTGKKDRPITDEGTCGTGRKDHPFTVAADDEGTCGTDKKDRPMSDEGKCGTGRRDRPV